jgi:hypothetical protein
MYALIGRIDLISGISSIRVVNNVEHCAFTSRNLETLSRSGRMWEFGREHDGILCPKALAEEESLSNKQKEEEKGGERRGKGKRAGEDNRTTRPKTSSSLLEDPTPQFFADTKNNLLLWHNVSLDEDALRPLHVPKGRPLRLHISLQCADFRLETVDLGGCRLFLFHQGRAAVLQGLDAVLVLLLDLRELLSGRVGSEDGVLYKRLCQC